jgi:YidC/Oxa1 family membrane protein insertase
VVGRGHPIHQHPGQHRQHLYLGPYLNILPLLAVGLMLWHQKKMMPPPADEQMAQQQKMMKIMMGMMAFFFYKVAAGLALYFIVGTIWGIIERQFIPKAPDVKPGDDAGATAELPPKPGSPNGQPAAPAKPKGFFGRFRQKLQEKMEELQKQAEEQSRRQIRNKPDTTTPPPRRDPERRDRKRKKRK